jgi:hypothetical protein
VGELIGLDVVRRDDLLRPVDERGESEQGLYGLVEGVWAFARLGFGRWALCRIEKGKLGECQKALFVLVSFLLRAYFSGLTVGAVLGIAGFWTRGERGAVVDLDGDMGGGTEWRWRWG